MQVATFFALVTLILSFLFVALAPARATVMWPPASASAEAVVDLTA